MNKTLDGRNSEHVFETIRVMRGRLHTISRYNIANELHAPARRVYPLCKVITFGKMRCGKQAW
ncbi:hypothetical protein PR048_011315 [Dryococelus australis]|uniref:Uncharacterized protein n=1 Tax=Dryococelus australis TaxID=614101 RepID=A0ABQ9HL92_9NEOP|nr:hypothetical protein PR048_011315 [Dryococelus australis]